MITREQMIEQSVYDYVKAGVVDYGYDAADLAVRHAFPTVNERSAELTKTTLAIGFNFDDGGQPAELGSNFTRYLHTIEFWIFATSESYGKNLASVVKHVLRRNGDQIPLLDYDNALKPAIDSMTVMKVAASKQINSSARPWDEHVYTVALQAEDFSFPT